MLTRSPLHCTCTAGAPGTPATPGIPALEGLILPLPQHFLARCLPNTSYGMFFFVCRMLIVACNPMLCPLPVASRVRGSIARHVPHPNGVNRPTSARQVPPPAHSADTGCQGRSGLNQAIRPGCGRGLMTDGPQPKHTSATQAFTATVVSMGVPLRLHLSGVPLRKGRSRLKEPVRGHVACFGLALDRPATLSAFGRHLHDVCRHLLNVRFWMADELIYFKRRLVFMLDRCGPGLPMQIPDHSARFRD